MLAHTPSEVPPLMSYTRLLVSHWTNGMAWLFFSVIAMLGLWGAGLAIFAFLANPPWLQLVDRGQFFLYSVGFLGQSMYILTKDSKITTIPHRRMLLGCTLLCFIVCTLIFCGNVLSNFSNSPEIIARPGVVRYLGLGILVLSLSIGFLVTVADEERGDVDIPTLGETGVRLLEDRIPEEPEE